MPSPPLAESLTFIQIRDFKPGITDNPGSNYPPGAAQRNATYRCIANRNGALVPLPKNQTPFLMPTVTTSSPIGVDGLYVPPIPLLPSPGTFTPNQFPEHEVFVGIEWLNAGTHYQNLYRNRRYEVGGGFDVIRSTSFADAAATLTPNGMSFVTARSERANWRRPGVPVVLALWGYGFNQNYLIEFPDDQSTNSNTPYTVFNNIGWIPLQICAHQGKIVMQVQSVYGHGVNTITFMGESTAWSSLNDVTFANWWGQRIDPDTGATSEPAVFIRENPSGLAFYVSMSANELFGVKTSGGFYVTGDLDAGAFAVSLPMVTGSELLQRPAIVDAGVVYGNRTSGVWVWTHGSNSTLLSPAMIPDFWVISPGGDMDEFGQIAYQFARCDEWILVPNNWLFDTALGSWWRLEDEAICRIRYFTTLSHFIYGSESFYTNADNDPIHEWIREDKALSYSWQSHPLWETIDNLVDIREISLRVLGTGTVKVTATGETSSSFVTFTGINTTVPVLLRQPIRVQDANVAIRIESSGPTTAPTVYECNVGFFAAQKERITF